MGHGEVRGCFDRLVHESHRVTAVDVESLDGLVVAHHRFCRGTGKAVPLKIA